MDPSQDNNDEVNALETPEVPTNGESKPSENDAPKDTKPEKKKSDLGSKIRGIISHLNIYLLLFILILVIAGGIVVVGIQRGKKQAAQPSIQTTPLTAETIDQLRGSEAKVGDPKQTLSIESNTIFTGKILARDSLDVAGELKIGGILNVPGITVSGASTFDQITANDLSVSGDTSIQGSMNVQNTLTVAGGATFGGPISAPQLTVESLQLSGDLAIIRHIDAGGPSPGVTGGSALGGGGTVSISGTDTAGTVTINVGGGPPAGCFATVNFVNSFNGTPHVVITPVGSAAAGLNYYINRNASSFSICSTNPAATGASFSFDYVAID